MKAKILGLISVLLMVAAIINEIYFGYSNIHTSFLWFCMVVNNVSSLVQFRELKKEYKTKELNKIIEKYNL